MSVQGRKVAAIIQARMSSSRLPGKVLRPLAGMPVLEHVVRRMARAETVDTVAIATSTDPSDDALERFADDLGIPCIRGPLDNVLMRYVMAAEALQPDVVIRVTGDAPLVDPRLTDLMVRAMVAAEADFVDLQTGGLVSDEGYTPMSRRALDRLAAEHGDHPAAREHVSGYRRVDPGFGRTLDLPLDEDRGVEGARLSVDTPDDLAFMEALYAALDVPAPEAEMTDVLALLRRRPDLLAINGHVRQKSVDHRGLSVLIRCDGGAGLGLGHVRRCLAVAERLRDEQGAVVHVAVVRDAASAALFAGRDFRVHRPADGGADGITAGAEAAWLRDLAASHRHQAILLDVRTGLTATQVEGLRGTGRVVAVLDDPSPRRLVADLAFYPPPAPEDAPGALDWSGFRGRLQAGWDWMPLGRNFAAPRPDPGPAFRSGRVLLSLGGADPDGIAPRAAAVLRDLPGLAGLELIAGPAVPWLAEAADLEGGPVIVRQDCDNLAPPLDRAALAVIGFGVTAYEAAARGRASVLLCRSDADLATAGRFVEAGIAALVDLRRRDWAAETASQVATLLADPDGLAAMGGRAAALVDGRGASRIAACLAEAVRHLPMAQSA